MPNLLRAGPIHGRNRGKKLTTLRWLLAASERPSSSGLRWEVRPTQGKDGGGARGQGVFVAHRVEVDTAGTSRWIGDPTAA
jgi:hypothetical protein